MEEINKLGDWPLNKIKEICLLETEITFYLNWRTFTNLSYIFFLSSQQIMKFSFFFILQSKYYFLRRKLPPKRFCVPILLLHYWPDDCCSNTRQALWAEWRITGLQFWFHITPLLMAPLLCQETNRNSWLPLITLTKEGNIL